MTSPLFLDSAGSQRAAVQLVSSSSSNAVDNDQPSSTLRRSHSHNPHAFSSQSSAYCETETPEQRRTRLSVTLRRAAEVAEIALPDGSVASLPLCPGGFGPTRGNSNWEPGPLRRSATCQDTFASDERRSASCTDTVSSESTSGSRPCRISATRSMKDLRKLRADAASAAAPCDPRSRVTLEDKVILRLSELLSDSLLQTKLMAMGVLAEDGDEDVEWMTAGELASSLCASSSSSSSSLPPTRSNCSTPAPDSTDNHDEAMELLHHAKCLRSCPSSRRTLVKAAELFEELVGCKAS